MLKCQWVWLTRFLWMIWSTYVLDLVLYNNCCPLLRFRASNIYYNKFGRLVSEVRKRAEIPVRFPTHLVIQFIVYSHLERYGAIHRSSIQTCYKRYVGRDINAWHAKFTRHHDQPYLRWRWDISSWKCCLTPFASLYFSSAKTLNRAFQTLEVIHLTQTSVTALAIGALIFL